MDKQQLIATGLTSEVYAWDHGRVLKLFYRDRPTREIEQEYVNTRAVRAAGVCAPAAYEVVEVGGRKGIILERVEGPSMFNCVSARPWTLFAAARRLAELHAQLHAVPAPAEPPPQDEQIERWIDAATTWLPVQGQDAREQLAQLPRGTAICHGDFHPENILLSEHGPGAGTLADGRGSEGRAVIIDWQTATRGNPLADVTLRVCFAITPVCRRPPRCTCAFCSGAHVASYAKRI